MTDEFPYFYNQELDEETNKKVNMEIKKFAGMYILKKMDLKVEDGGHIFEVPLMGVDEHLEPILDDLLFHDLIEIDTVNTKYKITQEGRTYIDQLIIEIESYINKYQDFEPTTRVNLMKRDKVNPLRARFLWGLYDGEFDDFDVWQDNRDINPVERIPDWQNIIVKKEFYDMLFEEINHMEELDDDALNEVMQEAINERERNKPSIQINRVEGSGGSSSRYNRQNRGDDVVTEQHYYHDPYYFNPVYDPLFWYIVF